MLGAAPAPMTARRRLAALGAVALAACAIGVAARESGALAPLEREALKARFDVRGTEPVEGLARRRDRRQDLHRPEPAAGPSSARCTPSVVRAPPRRAAPRAIVYDVQFTEPTNRREDLALYDAIGDAGGAILATSESDDGQTRVLGGDENLRAIDSRAAASDLRNDTSGAIASFPREVGGLESIAVATAERLTRPHARSGRLPRRPRLDRLPRPARHDPDRLLLGRPARPGARLADPRQDRRGRRHRADAARRALDARRGRGS